MTSLPKVYATDIHLTDIQRGASLTSRTSPFLMQWAIIINEDNLLLMNSKLRSVHSALINSEPWLDSLEWPTGSWKGHSVLQRADGVEEAEGSSTRGQTHTHIVTQTLSHAWRPLCALNHTTRVIHWLKINASVGIRHTPSVHHQRFCPHDSQTRMTVRWAVWVGLVLLLPVGRHRGSKRARLHLLHEQDQQSENMLVQSNT